MRGWFWDVVRHVPDPQPWAPTNVEWQKAEGFNTRREAVACRNALNATPDTTGIPWRVERIKDEDGALLTKPSSARHNRSVRRPADPAHAAD